MRTPRAVPVLVALALVSCSRPAASPGGSATPGPAELARPLPSPVPDVVARVNGRSVRIHQILALAKAELDRMSVAERDGRKPEALRLALEKYVDRELLLQEALARGVEADSREVEWAFDQMRRERRDEEAWTEFLAGQGLDERALRGELRAQLTVEALLDAERRAGRDPDALLARLRSSARIERLL
jgi:hypothetical protein